MELTFGLGDMVIIDTSNNGKVRGIVINIQPLLERVSLVNNNWLSSDIIIEGLRHYYRSDMLSIKVVYTKYELDNPSSPQNIIRLLPVEDFYYVKNVSKNYKFIDTDRGGVIHKALKDLESHEYIGLHGELSHAGHWGTLHVLVLSTCEQIYVFDVLALRKLYLFKTVLESKQLKKIVHDCRGVTDALKTQHNIQLANVLDTMAVDIYITSQNGNKYETVPSIADSVSKYLGVEDLGLMTKPINKNLFSLRPLSQDVIKSMVDDISYIHLLSQRMDDALMQSFNDDCDKRLKECLTNSKCSKL